MRTALLASLAPLVLAAIAVPVHAQSYGDDGDESAQDEAPAAPARRIAIDPYVEASQIVSWQLSPGDDVVTYTQLAAGVDASIQGRNNGATVSVRYERNFGWQDAPDSDSITGLARGYVSIVPRVLTFEAGALASRTRTEAGGGSVINPVVEDGLGTTTYSAYAGPNLTTRAGPVDVSANYRIGYTKVDSPDFVTGGVATDVFDESVTHSANLRAGTRPGDPLPVGVGVGAGFYQEDVSNLDQRVRDAYARGDVTVPIAPTLQVVAGVGVEDVEVSSRDALRDSAGNPVIGPDGRFVTDKSAPRRIAYEADGLIWDVGVIWRPSRRTALEAHFGHRYDSATFYGNFSWAPSSRSNLSIGVYDGIQGFGGRLNTSLASLPSDFEIIRDPVTGDITGCVNAATGADCLGGLYGSLRSAVFRGRGVTAAYSRRIGQMTAGIGAGYDRRSFIAAPGTVLAAANGLVDQSWYVSGSLSGPIGPDAAFGLNAYANWYEAGGPLANDLFSTGVSGSYTRSLTRNLSARAAVALSMLDAENLPDNFVTASALVGLRYDFN